MEVKVMDENDSYDLSRLGLNSYDVYLALAQQNGVPFVDLSVYRPTSDALMVVPPEIAYRYNVFPVRAEGNTLYLAMADIHDNQALDEIRRASLRQVRVVQAVPEAIRAAIRQFYPENGQVAGG
jgi:type IV pilus assembly protein PilB